MSAGSLGKSDYMAAVKVISGESGVIGTGRDWQRSAHDEYIPRTEES